MMCETTVRRIINDYNFETTPEERNIKLRWLEKTRVYRTWYEETKEYGFQYYPNEPVLQYWNGKEWANIPTVKVEEKQFTDNHEKCKTVVQ